MTEKSKHPNREAKVFDPSWETEDDPEDAGHVEDRDESGEDDFEGHASGFNRPSQRRAAKKGRPAEGPWRRDLD
ncbi:MAG: hypothetical protein E6G02_12965 [Actinobacteria bacterium]|nr:MAG: hypothetical protein E6G02_12965 [Actinomycetota bacterium]